MSVWRNPWLLSFVGICLLSIVFRTIPVRLFFAVDAPGELREEQLLPNQDADSTLDIALDVVSQRPLFNVTRKAPESAPAPVEPTVREVVIRAPTPVLMGTMKNRQGVMIAYVRFGEIPDSVRLQVGDYRDPWEVESIGDGVARLRNGEDIVELELDED